MLEVMHAPPKVKSPGIKEHKVAMNVLTILAVLE